MLRSSRTVLCTSIFLLAACGERGDIPPPQQEGDAAAAQPATPPAMDPQAGEGIGEGTIRIGDAVYAFTVRRCDLTGDADDMYQTVSAVGTAPDGESFQVFVSRNEVDGMLMHSVSLQMGDVARGAGTVLEAQRMLHGGTWMSMSGGPAEPLIEIDGDEVTASGLFAPADGSGPALEGELQATCS